MWLGIRGESSRVDFFMSGCSTGFGRGSLCLGAERLVREVQADSGCGHPTQDRILRQVLPSSEFRPSLIGLRRGRPVSLEKPLGQEHQPALSAAHDQQGLVGRIHPFHDRAEMIPDPGGARKGPPMGDTGFETVGMEAVGAERCSQTGPPMRSARVLLEVHRPD